MIFVSIYRLELSSPLDLVSYFESKGIETNLSEVNYPGKKDVWGGFLKLNEHKQSGKISVLVRGERIANVIVNITCIKKMDSKIITSIFGEGLEEDAW